MNITEALTYIHSVCWRGSIPGLSRTQELLRRMGNPEKKLKFVHIAGTNGKGSTAAMDRLHPSQGRLLHRPVHFPLPLPV